jgi:putative glutamine amidotransferase
VKIAISVSEKEKLKGQESPYFQALVKAGARPDELRLVSVRDRGSVRARDFDGILFAGGEDVDPQLYDEKARYASVHASRERDDFEFELLDEVLHLRLPLLGICRGMQMINVRFGGTLYQDLKEDTATEREHKQPGNRNAPTHRVTVTDPESRVATAIHGSCRVNSLHHQAVKRLGRGLKVTARSEDGLVEAVEAADEYPFLMAVQWHPEEMADVPEQRRLLEQFVAKCREAAARRA